jgi:hypothetical protein
MILKDRRGIVEWLMGLVVRLRIQERDEPWCCGPQTPALWGLSVIPVP